MRLKEGGPRTGRGRARGLGRPGRGKGDGREGDGGPALPPGSRRLAADLREWALDLARELRACRALMKPLERAGPSRDARTDPRPQGSDGAHPPA